MGREEYWDELSRLLRAAGLPPGHVAATVDELAGPGPADPAREWGPPAALADRLAPGPAPVDEHVETWRWAADTYADVALLDRFGAEGWEVDHIDALGRFVGHRDPEHPQPWQYRRELTTRDRPSPEGWEPCGTWAVYAWYKRPAVTPPAPAGPHQSPAPPAPRRAALSRGLRAAPLAAALALIAAAAACAITTGASFATGALTGAALPPLIAWCALKRRTRTREEEPPNRTPGP